MRCEKFFGHTARDVGHSIKGFAAALPVARVSDQPLGVVYFLQLKREVTWGNPGVILEIVDLKLCGYYWRQIETVFCTAVYGLP